MRAGETYNYEKPIAAPKNNKSKNKKRFSGEQIKSLESIFKLESRLDPRKKVQVATDLDLQPRQVAIWFQNRRARWKSKHLETEYAQLKAKFDCLKIQFEALKEEKEFLLKQLEALRNLMKNQNGEESSSKDIGDDGSNRIPVDALATYSSEHLDIRLTKKDETPGFESLNFGDYVEKSLGSSEEWSNLELGGLFDHSSDTSKWWDFSPISET